MSDETSPDTITPLGADPVDVFIPINEQRRLLQIKSTLGYAAFVAHVKIARGQAHDTQQREAQAKAHAEQSRERDRRRYFDKHTPQELAAAVLDWSAFDDATRARLSTITNMVELAAEVGRERLRLGLEIPVLARPHDETYEARLRELQRRAADAEQSRR